MTLYKYIFNQWQIKESTGKKGKKGKVRGDILCTASVVLAS